MKKLIATLFVALAAGFGVATVHAGTSGASTPANCGAKPDRRGHWEVVYGTKSTRTRAHKLLVSVRGKKFLAWIEVDSCRAFEVARARFANLADAQNVVRLAKKAGFTKAKTEDS
jgi:hypothetical protein